MPRKTVRTAAGAVCAGLALAAATVSMFAQQAPQPLQAMPYSPSLDPASLDRSVDPCADFYKFSCGGWQKNNPIPADQAAWSVYAQAGQREPAVSVGHPGGGREGEGPDAGAAEGGRLLRRVHGYGGDRPLRAWSRCGRRLRESMG